MRGGHAKGQPHLHAATVHAHGLVNVVANFGKGFNLGHQAGNLFYAVAQQLPGHKGVLPPGKVGVKAHAQFEQGGHAAADVHAASGGLRGTGEHLEQGALASAIDADDADCLARIDGKAHVLHDPLEGVTRLGTGQHPFRQSRPAGGILPVGLAQVGDGDGAH